MLTERDQEILKAVHFYRYMTVQDVAYRFFSPRSESHVRELLSTLCGKADEADNQYLYRFGLPKTRTGNTERVFVLGARGREFLINNTHLSVNWYGNPRRMAGLSYNILYHSLSLTRVLVAASFWGKQQEAYKLIDTKIAYGLANRPGKGGNDVIPDGWLLFERTDKKKGAILLEIDRTTEYQERFKQHVASRLEFVRSGAYEKQFGERSAIIAYLAVFGNEAARESRRRSMMQWAREVLKDVNLENWGSLFRFGHVGLEDVYKANLFDGAVWYMPDKKEQIPLFGR
jgi:hypothetical protein